MVTLAVERNRGMMEHGPRGMDRLVDSSPCLILPLRRDRDLVGSMVQAATGNLLFRDFETGGGWVAHSPQTASRPRSLRRVCLNACGEDGHDETSLFNDLLCLPGYGGSPHARFELLEHTAWDEFVVPGCRRQKRPGETGLRVRTCVQQCQLLHQPRRLRKGCRGRDEPLPKVTRSRA
jgi:hypothetical protein